MCGKHLSCPYACIILFAGAAAGVVVIYKHGFFPLFCVNDLHKYFESNVLSKSEKEKKRSC